MDGMQFGRWFHERRRSCGFVSQRALAEQVKLEPALAVLGISEAFLARLETGQLAYPFRGLVRKRVLALAQYFCHTPRELQAYLKSAELTDLTGQEAAEIAQLRQRLSTQPVQKILALPPQPAFQPMQREHFQSLLAALSQAQAELLLVTGMPGSGKSALVSAVVHQLVHDGSTQLFPDGIIFLSCRGYSGVRGLILLLEQLLQLCDSHSTATQPAHTYLADTFLQDTFLTENAIESLLSSLLNRARHVLANRSMLFVLDDVEATFPLRRALEALLKQGQAEKGCVLLVTSCYHFSSALIKYHLHLGPLSPADAFAYIISLAEHVFASEELPLLARVCELVGYHPLALEGLAAALKAGVPLSLLYANPESATLKSVFTYEPDLRYKLDYAFNGFSKEMQRQFALLANAGVSTFSSEYAVSLTTSHPASKIPPASALSLPFAPVEEKVAHEGFPLAQSALQLGQFVRHSLLELQQAASMSFSQTLEDEQELVTLESSSTQLRQDVTRSHYRLHPLVRAYSATYLCEISPAELAGLHKAVRVYALSYLERYQGMNRQLLQERELLFYACRLAVEQEEHEEVIRFVTDLAPISCRLPLREDGNTLFRWGMQASQCRQDQGQESYFLYNLGWLLCQRGEFLEAQQAWRDALALAKNAHFPLGQAFLGLAHIAHLQGHLDEAVEYVEQYLQQCRESAETIYTLSARIRLATFQALQGKHAEPYATLCAVLRTPLLQGEEGAQSLDIFVLKMQACIELEKLQNDYTSSQGLTMSLATVLREQEEPYPLAYLLFQQAQFARQRNQREDLPEMGQLIMRAAEEINATYFRHYGAQMLQEVAPLWLH